MRHITRHRKTTAVAGALATSVLVLTGCSDSAGPEAGVTTEELTQLEERVGAFEDRIGALEEGAYDERIGALEEEVSAFGTEAGVGEDDAVEGTQVGAGQDIIGQEVTISAEVSEVITTTDVGSAFRVAGQEGPSVAVLATAPPPGIDVGDVVQITGTVQMVQRDSFEQDFGIGADELFDDPDGFFTDAEGQPAIAAQEVEVLEETSE